MGALTTVGKKKSLDHAEFQRLWYALFADAKSLYRLALFCASAFWSSYRVDMTSIKTPRPAAK